MLLNLHVKNLALIEETEIDFRDHLNILTGETGAGKSILIGAVSAALGNKIPKDMIRNGCDYALIELLFSTQSEKVKSCMEAMEIPWEDGEIIISRRITGQRTINKINDVTVTAGRLKELAPLLIDLSGQHENQILLKPANHRLILDHYSKNEIQPLKDQLALVYDSYKDILKKLESEQTNEQERSREMEYLQFEIREINNARLRQGEDTELEAQYRLMEHSKDIRESAALIYDATNDDRGGASRLLGNAVRYMSDIVSLDENASELSEQISVIDSLLNDFNRDLQGYISEMEFDEETFHDVEQRLDQINHLKSKYGDSIELIMDYCEKAQSRYELLLHYEEYIDGVKTDMKRAESELTKLAQQLSDKRRQAALPLQKSITDALIGLNFADVNFFIDMKESQMITASGKDEICFMISTNPGIEPGPLHEIASGGELSRILLAIKSILAQEDRIETVIFDEIDTGISGRTAQMVSERLARMGHDTQVIAITHLPQIAAMADHHYLIEKTSDSHSTISSITLLSEEESVGELARMLGGAAITETVIDNAREMKKLAVDKKKKSN